ncbi:transmembrane protein 64 [Vigna radiata var. radiata]|uniref:Transmembrane protein 64 n=1 Tax=Vigna radiata var. radiata TaxID=3916 RepID=A0A1S3VP61_VIGRR|nr:transmembrane protein 64 [Vigna radiata var. radiata]
MTYLDEDGINVDGDHTKDVMRNHGGGEYIKLRWDPQSEATISTEQKGSRIWYWVKSGLCFLCLGCLALLAAKWVGPLFLEKAIIPMINWGTNRFSSPELAVLVFASVALFPTLVMPSSPSMWVAGMTFGYCFGFLLIISAAAIGVSLPFLIGSIFHHKIEEWLEKYPKKASLLRCAGGGNWFHQFRAVALIRVSPFPYILYNYCAVATRVKYWPYLIGSLVGMVPEIFVSIYTGILIKTLANARHHHHTLSAPEIIVNVVGFCVTVGTIIFFTVYAKRKLKELRKVDDLLLK